MKTVMREAAIIVLVEVIGGHIWNAMKIRILCI